MDVGNLVATFVVDTKTFFKAQQDFDALAAKIKQGADSFGESFLKVGQASTKMGQDIKKAADTSAASMQALAGALAPFLSVAALVGFAKSVVNVNDRIQDLADQTGFSAERLSSYRATLENAGLSVDTFARSMQFAQRNLGTIDSSTDRAAVALKKLGLSVEELQGMSPEQFFDAVAGQLSQISSRSERAALSSAIFARSGVVLGSVLEKLVEDQAKLNGLSNETIGALADLADSMNTLYIAVQNMLALDLVKIMRSTAKEVVFVVDLLARLIGRLIELQNSLPKFAFQQKIVDFLDLPGMKKSVDEFGKNAQGFVDSLDPWKGGIDKWVESQKKMDDALKGGGGGIGIDQKKMDELTKSLNKQIAELKVHAMELRGDEEAAIRFKLSQEIITAVGEKNAGMFAKQREEIVKLTMANEAFEEIQKGNIAAAQSNAKAWTEMIDKGAAAKDTFEEIGNTIKESMGTITLDQLDELKKKLLAAEGALESVGQTTDATTETFYKLLKAINELSVTAAFRTPDYIKAQVQDVEQQLEQLQIRLGNIVPAKALTDSQQAVGEIFDSLTNGIESTMRGVVEGSQTLGDGMKNLARNMVMSFNQEILKLGVFNPIKNMLMKWMEDSNFITTPGAKGSGAAPQFNFGAIGGAIAGLFGNMFGGGGGGFGLENFDWSVFEFQRGGIVPGRRGQAVPIIAHAGEQIVPLSGRMGSGGGGGGGARVIINGDIIPRSPNLSRDDVVQIGLQQFDDRGIWQQALENRMSPRR